jgi:hypothetical protein
MAFSNTASTSTALMETRNSLRSTLRLIGITAAPHVVALGPDAAKDGFRADGGWHRLLHAQKKFLSQ